MTVNFSNQTLGRIVVSDPVLKADEKRLLEELQKDSTLFQRCSSPLTENTKEALFEQISENMKSEFPKLDGKLIESVFVRLNRKYNEIKAEFIKRTTAVKPEFLKIMSFIEKSRLYEK